MRYLEEDPQSLDFYLFCLCPCLLALALGRVHRSNSCCMYLMAENKMAGKLPPWSHRMDEEPPDSVFLLASITYPGASAHHTILHS